MKNAKKLKSHMDDMWIEHILIDSFRYNLGRRSYSPSVCMDFLTPLLPYMHVENLKLISREIGAYKFDSMQWCEDWNDFKSKVDKQIEKRSKDE